MSPPDPLQARYRIGRALGAGGMATVYDAVDTRTGAECAVKVLIPSMARDPVVRARFEREGRAMARLRHPNLLKVQDIAVDGPVPFLVLELAPGGSLVDRLATGPLRPGVACDVVAGVLSGLHHAHERGIVHRDVKPDNVLFTLDGVPMLSDFGLALHGVESPTPGARKLGTDLYMAPEQRQSAWNVDRRADVYSAGVMLYTLVTGNHPADIDDSLLAGIDPDVAEVIRTATRHHPVHRYPTAEAMRVALVAARWCLPEEPVDLLRTTPLPAPPRTRASSVLLAVVVALALTPITAAGAAAGLAWWIAGL